MKTERITKNKPALGSVSVVGKVRGFKCIMPTASLERTALEVNRKVAQGKNKPRPRLNFDQAYTLLSKQREDVAGRIGVAQEEQKRNKRIAMGYEKDTRK